MAYKVDYTTHMKQLSNYAKAHKQWWGSPPVISMLAKDNIFLGVADNRRIDKVMFKDEKHYVMFMLRYS